MTALREEVNIRAVIEADTEAVAGSYNHIAKVGRFISIGGTDGVNPATGQPTGTDAYWQAKQIIAPF